MLRTKRLVVYEIKVDSQPAILIYAFLLRVCKSEMFFNKIILFFVYFAFFQPFKTNPINKTPNIFPSVSNKFMPKSPFLATSLSSKKLPKTILEKNRKTKNKKKTNFLAVKKLKKRFSKLLGVQTDLRECDGAQCANGATCYTNVLYKGGYECVCQTGYFGSLCDRSLVFFHLLNSTLIQ